MILAITLAPLAHLLGDYALQSHVMAVRKTSSWLWASIHATFYSLPFAVLLFLMATPDRVLPALAVIAGTHAVIDRYRLAAYWCRWWGVGFPGVWDRLARRFAPYPSEVPAFEAPPPFLGVWLVILVDNTAHLCINAAAIAWAVA